LEIIRRAIPVERHHLRGVKGPAVAVGAQCRDVGRVIGAAVGEPVEDWGAVVALVEQLEQACWSIGDVALRGVGRTF
jgi:hypothetical protein